MVRRAARVGHAFVAADARDQGRRRWAHRRANSNGYLVTAYGGAIDTTVKLWDLESATCLTSFQAAHPVSSLLAGDGKLLLFYEPDRDLEESPKRGDPDDFESHADFEVRDLATGSVARSIANPRYEPLGSDSHSSTSGRYGRYAHRERVRGRSVVRAAIHEQRQARHRRPPGRSPPMEVGQLSGEEGDIRGDASMRAVRRDAVASLLHIAFGSLAFPRNYLLPS